MTNTTTPPNTRSNNVAGNQPLATQQPTTTEKIKDSAKSAVSKAQNVLTGSNTKTMTPPSNNDATRVIGDNRRHHEKADIVGSVDGRHHDKTNISAAYDVSKNKAENKAAGNVVGKVEGTTEHVTGLRHNNDRRPDLTGLLIDDNSVGNTGVLGARGLSNDVGCTDEHGAKCTGHENRLDQQTKSVPPQQMDLAPPPAPQQRGLSVHSNAFNFVALITDNTRSANDPGDIIVENAGPVDISLSGNLTGRSAGVNQPKLSGTSYPGQVVQVGGISYDESDVIDPLPSKR
ncbi:hypothetical protein GGH94_000236 [Coemansia aciculifera]|uniref:Uncharacterized protein n=1 Tax=Coemansia aciculifera TaxID=417176 RepID=A0A9W8M8R8_9FUNG|nr:hypothetical protein GGH94_000236 [Coemansia aciculifera]KAJ2877138.1 hypothetical protein GGH93_000167 [Coemansia aciculifera]